MQNVLITDYEYENVDIEQRLFDNAGIRLTAAHCRSTEDLLKQVPDMDGITVLARLRANPDTRNLPIILVTARTTELDKVKGLDAGADDYITKPFGVMELISRVKALLRRTEPEKEEKPLVLGDIRLSAANRSCEVARTAVDLTYKEFELLSLLLQNAGLVLTRDVLMEKIWGTDFAGESRTLDMHIKTLRQKLGAAGSRIKTVRNVGYLADQGGTDG